MTVAKNPNESTKLTFGRNHYAGIDNIVGYPIPFDETVTDDPPSTKKNKGISTTAYQICR